MSEPLFRQEVIDANKSTVYGEVLLLQPKFYNYALATILLLLLFIIIYILNGTYNKTERALGYLVPVDGLVDIYPYKQGVIEKIFVKNLVNL